MFSMGATPPSSSSSSDASSFQGDDYLAARFSKAASAAGAATLAAAAATAFSTRTSKQKHKLTSDSRHAPTRNKNFSYNSQPPKTNKEQQAPGFMESTRDHVVDKVIETILAASIPEASDSNVKADLKSLSQEEDEEEDDDLDEYNKSEEEEEDDDYDENIQHIDYINGSLSPQNPIDSDLTITPPQNYPSKAGTSDHTEYNTIEVTSTTSSKRKKRKSKHKPQQELSLSILASNIRKLNSRAGLLLQLQSNVVHILSWHQPSATISILILYAIICFNPYLLVAMPITLILFAIMAPGYNRRHPIPIELTPTQFYRHKVGHNFADAEEIFRDEQNLVSSARQAQQVEERRIQEEEHEQRVLRERLRDLQNMLSALIKSIETLEIFVARVGSFADEEKATAIYLILLVTLVTTVYFASFVPVNFAILCAGWAPVLLLHPKLGRYAKKAKDKYIDLEEPVVLDILNYVQEHDVIIDDPPESRTVEIYELQRQGLTPRQWTPWVFTSEIYDMTSISRRAKERPVGSRFLSDVKPPEGWIFSDDRPWKEDTQPKNWVLYRGLRHVDIDLDTNWVYDYSVPGGSPEEKMRRRKAKEMKKKRYSELVDADEYYIPSDAEDETNFDGDDVSDDYLYDGDEYYMRGSESVDEAKIKVAEKQDLLVRGEWRRRRWIRECFRL